ncbi:alpha/beta fold hydrolase [Actinacidiphila reveromycinica]|nr:alpha/beta hydrolase [Streptomyces sp. SN-593]
MTITISGDARLRVADSGGSGPAVLFLHGNLMDHTMWDGVVAELAGYRCIRFDFRLHGATEDSGEPFTYWTAARDALAVLEGAGVRSAHLVGHSQGGFTALRAALLRPAAVRSLTLIDTAATAFPGEALGRMAQIRDGFAAGAGADLGADADHDLDATLDGAPAPGAVPDPVTATGAAVLRLLLGPDQPAAASWLERLRRQPPRRLSTAVGTLMGVDDILPRLAEVTAPATVIHGTDDLPIPVGAGRALAAALPAAVPAHLIEGAGHTPPITHPVRTAALLAAFLRHT